MNYEIQIPCPQCDNPIKTSLSRHGDCMLIGTFVLDRGKSSCSKCGTETKIRIEHMVVENEE